MDRSFSLRAHHLTRALRLKSLTMAKRRSRWKKSWGDATAAHDANTSSSGAATLSGNGHGSRSATCATQPMQSPHSKRSYDGPAQEAEQGLKGGRMQQTGVCRGFFPFFSQTLPSTSLHSAPTFLTFYLRTCIAFCFPFIFP